MTTTVEAVVFDDVTTFEVKVNPDGRLRLVMNGNNIGLAPLDLSQQLAEEVLAKQGVARLPGKYLDKQVAVTRSYYLGDWEDLSGGRRVRWWKTSPGPEADNFQKAAEVTKDRNLYKWFATDPFNEGNDREGSHTEEAEAFKSADCAIGVIAGRYA